MARRLLMWSSMLKLSATKTALVIAVLATPALAGGKASLNLKPTAPAVASAAKAKVGAPVKVAAKSADEVEAPAEPSGADGLMAAIAAAPSAPAAPAVAPAPAPAPVAKAVAVPSGANVLDMADEDERAEIAEAPVAATHGLAAVAKPEAKKTQAAKGEYDLGSQAFGTDYDVLKPGRRTALPGEAELVIVPRGLTAIQVGDVVKDRHAELDYCWQRLAIIDRVPSTAILKLKIDAKGAVTSFAVGGDAPAVVNACLKETVPHWAFPEAETKSELSYPVAFRSL